MGSNPATPTISGSEFNQVDGGLRYVEGHFAFQGPEALGRAWKIPGRAMNAPNEKAARRGGSKLGSIGSSLAQLEQRANSLSLAYAVCTNRIEALQDASGPGCWQADMLQIRHHAQLPRNVRVDGRDLLAEPSKPARQVRAIGDPRWHKVQHEHRAR